MTDETIEKTHAEAEKSLDDAIWSALDGPDEAPSTEDEASDDGAAERARDDKGRFAKKEQEPAPEEAAPIEATAADEAPVVDKSTDQPTDAEPSRTWEDGQFRGWSKEQRTRFESLPPEQQDVVMAYKAEADAAFTRRDQEASSFRKDAEPLIAVAKEAADLWASQNIAPADALRGYANIERTLTYGSYDQKMKLIGDICQTYGIPFNSDMATLDVDVDQYRARHDQNSEMARIQAENARLQRQFESYRAEQLQAQIAAFSAATHPDGSPVHPHFETVKAAMGGLLQSGTAQTLDEAYEMAVKPIEQAIAAQAAKHQSTTQQKQREALEKAKKAAPVKSSPAMPSGQAKPGGLDDVISQAMANAGWS